MGKVVRQEKFRDRESAVGAPVRVPRAPWPHVKTYDRWWIGLDDRTEEGKFHWRAVPP
jgi:hypothetical protein